MVLRRHRLRALIAIVAGLLQLHLFCVLQLHHHGIEALELSDLALRFDGHTHARSAEAPLLPCPACHVAEHSLIEPIGLGETADLIPLAGDAPLPIRFHYVFLGQHSLCGRDPPLS